MPDYSTEVFRRGTVRTQVNFDGSISVYLTSKPGMLVQIERGDRSDFVNAIADAVQSANSSEGTGPFANVHVPKQ